MQIKELSARLQARMETGDASGLLDNAVSELARSLAAAITQGGRDAARADVLQAVMVLVAVHWARYQLLPDGQDEDDLLSCLQWSAVLLPVAPHLVPEPVRRYLTGTDTSAGGPAADANQRGAAFYADYKRTENTQLLQNAIIFFREAVDLTPVGHPDRPGYLSDFGKALRARYERVGRQVDLDQAITVGEQAVNATPPGHPGRPGYLTNLGNALHLQYDRTREQADLDLAISRLS